MSLTTPQPWALLLLAVPAVLAYWAWRRGLWSERTGRVATGLRFAMATLIVLALTDLSVLRERDALSVVYVVDASRSVGTAADSGGGVSAAARAWVKESIEARPDGDAAGVVVFGGTAEIERLVRDTDAEPNWASIPESGSTNIESALRLAMASFPGDTHRRVVLLSDGVETHGQARRQADVARQLDIPIDTVALEGGVTGPDVIAEALHAPAEVEPDQPFDLRVHVRSPDARDARLLLYRDNTLLGAVDVKLEAGLDTIVLPQQLTEAGLHRFRVTVESAPDAEPRNNEARASVYVTGAPRVLLLAGPGGGAEHLTAALEGAGFSVTTGGEADFPVELEDVAEYDAILLSNLPATDADRLQLRTVAAYVEDLGRGLGMIGGDRSFGLGGYYKTPVERVLPVRMTRSGQLELPSQGIVLTIDRSGSMGGGLVSKMELAKEAAVAVVELMKSSDELGVVGFTGAASWVSPYAPLTDKDEVTRRIGTMRAGGGTDIYNALRASHRGIRGGDAAVKHVILLSDGISSTADFPRIIQELRADHITLTTVSIGSDSDRYTMERLAKEGGGRYYETDKAEAIPQIFTRETMLSSRNFLVDKPFVPHFADTSDIVRGIDGVPELGGFVGTSAKRRATVALTTPDGEPVLAHWRAGLGRSVAFTSDAGGGWSRSWLADRELYDQFWTQAVRWMATSGASEPLALATSLRGGTLTLTVDALQDGSWREGAETVATVIGPGGVRKEVPLRQVAPGRYRASMDAAAEGTWYVSVVQRLGDRELGRAIRELHRPWSPEFAPSQAGKPLLQEIAARTGGTVRPEPAAVWKHPPTPVTTPWSLVPWLLILAAALWLVDIAWRRLGRPAPNTASAPQLAVARTRAPRREAQLPDAKPVEAAPAAQTSTAKDEPPDDEPPSYTSRLLSAKKRGRK